MDPSQCWDGGYTADVCCDIYLPTGHELCWNGPFTHENCCYTYLAEKCSIQRTLQAGVCSSVLAALWLLRCCLPGGALRTDGQSAPAHHSPQQNEQQKIGLGGRRSALLDNAKFVLVALVVVEHFRTVNFNTFHVRTLCLISGILSKGDLSMHKLITHTIAPMVLFCAVEPLLLHGDYGGKYQISVHTRIAANIFQGRTSDIWYLQALICWRVWAAMLRPFRPLVRVALSLLVSALGGYVYLGEVHQPWYAGQLVGFPQGVFRLNNALALFPIFIVGETMPFEKLLFQGRLAAVLLVALWYVEFGLGANFVLYMPVAGGWAHYITRFCSESESALFWIRGLTVNMWYFTQGMLFLSICPRSHTLFTDGGSHSLYIYLLHKPLQFHGGQWLVDHLDYMPLPRAMKFVVVVFFAIIISFFLVSRPVRLIFNVILEPVWIRHLFVEERKQA